MSRTTNTKTPPHGMGVIVSRQEVGVQVE